MKHTLLLAVAVALFTGAFVRRPVRGDEPAAPATAPPASHEIDRSQIDSPEWKEAIATAKSHMSKYGGCYSLLRVVFKDPMSAEERIRVEVSRAKLKKLTKEYTGGGGRDHDVNNGGFVFVEHLPERRNEKVPLALKSLFRGKATIEIEAPTPGVLQVVGDVVVLAESNETSPNPIGLDDWSGTPDIGLLGKNFGAAAAFSGRWVKQKRGTANEPRLFFLVTELNGKKLETPARFEWVHATNREGHPLIAAVGETWSMVGSEKVQQTPFEHPDPALQRPLERVRKEIRVYLWGIDATVVRGKEL